MLDKLALVRNIWKGHRSKDGENYREYDIGMRGAREWAIGQRPPAPAGPRQVFQTPMPAATSQNRFHTRPKHGPPDAPRGGPPLPRPAPGLLQHGNVNHTATSQGERPSYGVHARMQTRTRTRASTLAHGGTHTHIFTHAHARTRTRAHLHARKNTHSHTHTHTRAPTKQVLAERGPPCSPASAIEQFGDWAYRACRMGENPWNLRKVPSHVLELTPKQLRGMVLSAVAMGNDPQHPSPLLHATDSIAVIIKMLGERRWLYSNWLVRWPQDCGGKPGHIDFQDHKRGGWILAESDDDTDLLRECVQKARGYVAKDRELVYLTSIPLKEIDWWCEETKQWQSAEDTIAWKPPPSAVERPPPLYGAPGAATSQAVSSQVGAKIDQASIQ